MTQKPITLGELLDPIDPANPPVSFAGQLRNTVYSILNVGLLVAIAALIAWWFLANPDVSDIMIVFLIGLLLVLWLFLFSLRHDTTPYRRAKKTNAHFLLANDRQHFMYDLRLDAKTAVFDGSNIYHFGHSNGVDAQPLGLIANQLRAEGYRIVCFFDANIFYTLSEHGAFPSHQRHVVSMLQDIFGLETNEIYVVPSKVQADKYILSCLRHLPISFAVTNDQFRDYARTYAGVMKGNLWRKGVRISKNEIKLQQHKFKTPVTLS